MATKSATIAARTAKKRRKKKSSRGLTVGLALTFIVALAAFTGLYAWGSMLEKDKTIFPNVRMAGVEIGGLTQGEARDRVETAVAQAYTAASLDVVLPDRTRYQDKASSYLDPALVAVDPPPQAESARLFLDFSLRYAGTTEDADPAALTRVPAPTYTLEGERQEGVFFFQLQRQYSHLGGENPTEEEQLLTGREDDIMAFLELEEPRWLSFSYVLTFYDSDGDLLETVTSP